MLHRPWLLTPRTHATTLGSLDVDGLHGHYRLRQWKISVYTVGLGANQRFLPHLPPYLQVLDLKLTGAGLA